MERSPELDATWRVFLAIGLYVAGSLIAIEVLDSGEQAWALVPKAVACVGLGWFSRTWWALLLAPLPIALAAPYGYSEENLGIEDELIWIFELYYTPLNALLIGAGVGLARFAAGLRNTSRTLG
jgi:hypothetical protein